MALAGSDYDPRLAAHIAECSACHARLTELDHQLVHERRTAIAEADAAFPSIRLERQRASVLSRIGGTRAAARILPFPGQTAAVVRPHHLWKRSIAAAAVVGLVLGAAAGRLLPSRTSNAAVATRAADRVAPPSIASVDVVRAAWSADEQFFEDFEAALGASRVEPLLALDALTPDLPSDLGVR